MNSLEKYILARWFYSIGEELISDIEYDRLELELKQMGEIDEYISRTYTQDPCPSDLLKKYNYEDKIKNVIFSYGTESIPSLNSIEKVEQCLLGFNELSRLSFKQDGFSIRLNYYNKELLSGVTNNRKNGNPTSLDSVRSLFKQKIDIGGKVLVLAELFLRNDKFEEYKQFRGITSQRSAVSTAIANGDTQYLYYTCFNIYHEYESEYTSDKYELLQSLGFPTPEFVMVRNYRMLLAAIKHMGMKRKNIIGPADGLVYENSTCQYAIRIFEWQEELNYSTVKGYVINRGMYGNHILCAIEPVTINGKTVNEIVITNLQNIIDNNLKIGNHIAFVERSGVNSVLDTTKTREVQLEFGEL